jgi:hypothetical protein
MSEVAAWFAGAVSMSLTADLNIAELVALFGLILLARRTSVLDSSVFAKLEQSLDRLGRHRRTALLAVALLAPALRLAVPPRLPVPEPVITDEFSHLLVADTLSRGRLANPPHPLWQHFESIHILQQPTYSSMYFPGQGAFLAIGKLLFGHAWAGVLLSTGLMCGAICWMLQGWLPPAWALLGGCIAVLRFGLVSYWANSYWGGSVAALGGALVLGAWPRLSRVYRASHGFTLGAGFALLLLTRPFEGLALSLPVSLHLLFTSWKSGRWRWMLPAAIVLLAASAFLGAYNAAVTGSPLRPPYAVSIAAYGWPMSLAWMDPPKVEHRHASMRGYYLWEVGLHRDLLHGTRGIIDFIVKASSLWRFFLGPALTIPLCLLPWIVRGRRLRPLLAAAGAVLLAGVLEQSTYPHYMAPAAAAFLAILVQGMRHLRRASCLALVSGRSLVRGIPILLLLMVAVRLHLGAGWSTSGNWGFYQSWCCSRPGNLARAGLLRRLESMEGRHLIFVRYGSNHDPLREWVYNEADIDRARVIWAREISPSQDSHLLQYFAGRKVWTVDADSPSPALMPYTTPTNAP